jgi:guanine nucleotide-binding protein G(I)/G(S)/G(T) subunit beta-1
MIIWDPVSSKKVGVIGLSGDPFKMFCAFEETEGDLIMTGGLQNVIDIYRVGGYTTVNPDSEMRGQECLSGHDGFVSCGRFLNRNKVLSCSGDATCILWDIENSKAEYRFFGHGQSPCEKNIGVDIKEDEGAGIMSLALSPTHPNLFITGSIDNTARVWDIRTQANVQCFSTHSSDVNSVVFLSNGYNFVSGSDDSTCRLFDTRAYKEMNCYQSESISSGCAAVEVSESGRLLFGAFCAMSQEENQPEENPNNQLVAYDTLCCESKPVVINRGVRISALALNHGRKVGQGGSAICTANWDTTIRVFA